MLGKFMRRHGVQVWITIATVFWVSALLVTGVTLTFNSDRTMLIAVLIGAALIFAGAAVQAHQIRKGIEA